MVQILAWRRSGDKPLSEPVMVCLLTRICVTRPHWVNPDNRCGVYRIIPIDLIWIHVHQSRVMTQWEVWIKRHTFLHRSNHYESIGTTKLCNRDLHDATEAKINGMGLKNLFTLHIKCNACKWYFRQVNGLVRAYEDICLCQHWLSWRFMPNSTKPLPDFSSVKSINIHLGWFSTYPSIITIIYNRDLNLPS